MYALIGMALEDANKNENDDDDKKGDGNMKHNVFDNDERKQDYLSHSVQEDIIKLQNRISALEIFPFLA